MQRGGRQQNAGAAGLAASWYEAACRRGMALAALAVCLVAGGCGTIAPALSPLTQNLLAQSRDITVAVESIDGPPRELAQKLISDLNSEGAPLKIAVVGAESEATYRMRGYLATHAAGSATAVTWALDVYDAGLNRAVRLSGEERVAGTGTAARSWTVADEAVLRRIAHAGMDQLSGFMAAPPSPAAPPPGPAAPVPNTVASRDTVASREPEPAGAAFAGLPQLAEAAPHR